MDAPGQIDASDGEFAITAAIDVHFQRGGAPATMPLGEWVAWVNSSIGQLTGEVSKLRALEGKVADLDSRLDEVLAAVDNLAVSGRDSEEDLDHFGYHRTFLSLINQHISALAELTATRRRLTDRDVGVLTSRICWILFGPTEPALEALLREVNDDSAQARDRVIRIFESGRDLRDRLAAHPEQHWDFGFQTGSRIDHRSQEEWSAAPADGIVEFVVVPSYVVSGNSILSKQRVYTAAPIPSLPVGPAVADAAETQPAGRAASWASPR